MPETWVWFFPKPHSHVLSWTCYPMNLVPNSFAKPRWLSLLDLPSRAVTKVKQDTVSQTPLLAAVC